MVDPEIDLHPQCDNCEGALGKYCLAQCLLYGRFAGNVKPDDLFSSEDLATYEETAEFIADATFNRVHGLDPSFTLPDQTEWCTFPKGVFVGVRLRAAADQILAEKSRNSRKS